MIDEEGLEDCARLTAIGGWIVDPAQELESLPLPGPETECTKQWPDALLIKGKWGDGPWILEPDFVVFRAKAPPHYRCAVWRHNWFGQLNGYVLLPSGHPAHGLQSGELEGLGCDGHRGLTFGAATPSGGWLVGFHTGHSFDYQPWLEARTPWLRRMYSESVPAYLQHTYRDLAYVRGEVEQLAMQLGAMGNGNA
jgi:hypothetical protein